MRRRPLRIQCADDIVVVSNGCFQNKHNLPTDAISNQRMLGALYRYAGIYSVDIYAYAFLPNGFWLVISAPLANRQNFMRDFQSWLGLWANARLDREGRFFHERYDDETLVDAGAVIDTIVDVLVAPVREGFVRRLATYTGATSWPILCGEDAPSGRWIDRDRLRSLRRTTPELPETACAIDHEVVVADPPVEDVGRVRDEEPISAMIRRLVDERVAEILEWQDERDEAEVRRRSERPHPAPWLAEPTEPIGPPRYRYGYTFRASTPTTARRRRKMRKQIRRTYSHAMGLWRKTKEQISSGLEADGGESIPSKGGGGEQLRDAGEITEVESGATPPCACQLRFPTSSIPPGWTKTRRPLRRWTLEPPPDRAPIAA